MECYLFTIDGVLLIYYRWNVTWCAWGLVTASRVALQIQKQSFGSLVKSWSFSWCLVNLCNLQKQDPPWRRRGCWTFEDHPIKKGWGRRAGGHQTGSSSSLRVGVKPETLPGRHGDAAHVRRPGAECYRQNCVRGRRRWAHGRPSSKCGKRLYWVLHFREKAVRPAHSSCYVFVIFLFFLPIVCFVIQMGNYKFSTQWFNLELLSINSCYWNSNDMWQPLMTLGS